MSEKGKYTHEIVTHEIDQNLFMTRSGKIVEGNFEVGDHMVVMHSDVRPMPVYKTRIDPPVEEPSIRKSLKSGARIAAAAICTTPVEIQYDTSTMDCSEWQVLTAVGCEGPYIWELLEGGGDEGGELEETEEPEEGVSHNYTATRAPEATDDETEGYGIHSRWKDIVTEKCYNCVDAKEDEAVWIEYKEPPDGGLGETIKYISPDENPDCEHNAKIRVRDYYKDFPDPPGYPTEAEIDIIVNCYHGSGVAYWMWTAWVHNYFEWNGQACNDDWDYSDYPLHLYTIRCGYNMHDCDMNLLSEHTVHNSRTLYGGTALDGPGGNVWCAKEHCPIEWYCGQVPTAPCSIAGGYMIDHLFQPPCGPCDIYREFCVGHPCGDVTDKRTSLMKSQGCCPEPLFS